MTLAAAADAPSPPRAVGWALLYLLGGFVLMVVLFRVGLGLSGGLDSVTDTAPRILAIQTLSGLIAFGSMTWLVGRRGAGLTWTDLRWTPLAGSGRGFLLGFGIGAVPACLALGLSLLVGEAHLLRETGTASEYAGQMFRTTLLLAPAALLEEVMFRGVGQVVLARAFGRLPTILALSALFALAHVKNANATPLGLLNIAVAGVLLGVAFYAPGGIWTAWGAHLGWNVTLAAFDAPVSGLPFRIPLIDYQPGGPPWLTGGSFGPEGGMLATIALVLATTIVWRMSRKELA